MTPETRPCLSFRLGADGFGVPLDMVEELAAVKSICPVPLAPGAVKGLTTWRGRVVTLLDLATLLGVERSQERPGAERLALILMKPYEHLGLYLESPVELAHEAMSRTALRAELFGEENLRPPEGTHEEGPGGAMTLVSVSDLVARCERAVLEQFRTGMMR